MDLNIVLFVLGFLLFAGGITASKMMSKESSKKMKLIPAIGVMIIIFSQCFAIVGTGYTGVKIAFGQVNETPVPHGWNFKIPFVEKIVRVNTRQQDVETSNENKIESTIEGKVPITISDVTVTYQVVPDSAAYIYANVTNPEDLLTYNIVSSAIKATTPSFNTDGVVVRSNVEGAVKMTLQDYINDKYGENIIDVLQITIGNISFTDEYNQSVNAKNVAKQEAETQDIVNQKNIDQANAEAESKLIAAQAEQEANDLMEKSITDKILMQQYLEKWNGALPSVTGSDNGIMLDVGQLMGE